MQYDATTKPAMSSLGSRPKDSSSLEGYTERQEQFKVPVTSPAG